MTKKRIDEISYHIIGCCISVHKELGAGLLESVYHKCLEEEFRHEGLKHCSEHIVPVNYREIQINTDLRADFLVEDSIVLELKAVTKILPIHEAQVLTYMKLLKKPKGIIVNFNCINIFKQGQKTFVNEYFRRLQDD